MRGIPIRSQNVKARIGVVDVTIIVEFKMSSSKSTLPG
jgi:hypothetical protein